MSELTDEQVERIRDFIAALRSGEYAQTQNTLARDNGTAKSYCCEGVAFERYGEALGYELSWIDPGEGGETLMYARDPSRALRGCKKAPIQFWYDMGVGSADATAPFRFELPEGMEPRDSDHPRLEFYDLNDDGLTFPQIADLIEWQFLGARGGQA